MRAWRTLRAMCGRASDEKKLPRGFSEKILAWAAPGLIPAGAAGQNGLAPAVLEAAARYTKSSSADLPELGFRLAWGIGRGLHWLQQKLIAVTLPRVFGEWPYENAALGEVRRANYRRARF
jgi:hypothetical protein